MLGIILLLLVSAYRNVARFKPVEQHLEYVDSLRAMQQEVETGIGQSLPIGTTIPTAVIVRLHQMATALDQLNPHLSGATVDRTKILSREIDRLGKSVNPTVTPLLDIINKTIDMELAARQSLLVELSADLHREKRVMTLLAALVPVLALGLLALFRQNVAVPVRKIADLLAELGAHHFKVVDTSHTPLTLRPVLENYNGLVNRLAVLEAEQQERQTTLERQVQLTTGSLMRLQGTLANAEKLAAVGEIAARIAHELRNPLAGIRTALGNLGGEVKEPDQKARLHLVIGELKRMTSLLNHLLEQTSVASETLVSVHIAEAMAEVIQLAKLQLPESITIKYDIDPALYCLLPEDRFRQAIFNLILNSGQIIGEQPGRIDIRGTQQNARIEIVIRDSGPGFPAAVIESGAQLFLSHRDQGTGLGLAIVRRFAQDLGGSMTISNTQHHGAQVVLILPCGGQSG